MRALVFIGGEAPPPQRLARVLAARPLIIGADSGVETIFAWGLEPDLVVGDMDSVDPEVLGRVKPEQIERFPTDKDYTDTELALRAAASRGCEDWWLVGGGGGRLDHLLGLWALFGRPDRPRRWYTKDDEVLWIADSMRVDLGVGTVLSFFAFGSSVRVQTSGLQWNLDGLNWRTGDAGLSNRTTGPLAVTMVSGNLVLVRSTLGEEAAIDG